jgi:hypothetical protein
MNQMQQNRNEACFSLRWIKLAETLFEIIHHLDLFFLRDLAVSPICTIRHA